MGYARFSVRIKPNQTYISHVDSLLTITTLTLVAGLTPFHVDTFRQFCPRHFATDAEAAFSLLRYVQASFLLSTYGARFGTSQDARWIAES
jgi:hypothetical protein